MAKQTASVATSSKFEGYDLSEFDEIDNEVVAYFRNDPKLWKETSNGNGMCRVKRNTFVNATETAGVTAPYVVKRRTFQGDETISSRWEFADAQPSEGDELTDISDIIAAL